MVPLSILDLVPVAEGSTPREALARSLKLAQHAERVGVDLLDRGQCWQCPGFLGKHRGIAHGRNREEARNAVEREAGDTPTE